MATRTLAVMVLIETDDPTLFPENLDNSTIRAVKRLRDAVVRALPGLSRVVALMSEPEARLMFAAHKMACEQAGIGEVLRPPAQYVAPEDQKRRREKLH